MKKTKAQQQQVQPPQEYEEEEQEEEDQEYQQFANEEEYRQYMLEHGEDGGEEGFGEDEIELFEPDPNYEPTEEEVLQYAQFLGMEFPGDEEFLKIAQDGLTAPLPQGWCMAQVAHEEQPCYFDQETQQLYQDNPNDEYFRQQFLDEKRLRDIKKQRANPVSKTGSKARSKLRNLIDQYSEEVDEDGNAPVSVPVSVPVDDFKPNNELKKQGKLDKLEEKNKKIEEQKSKTSKKANQSNDKINQNVEGKSSKEVIESMDNSKTLKLKLAEDKKQLAALTNSKNSYNNKSESKQVQEQSLEEPKNRKYSEQESDDQDVAFYKSDEELDQQDDNNQNEGQYGYPQFQELQEIEQQQLVEEEEEKRNDEEKKLRKNSLSKQQQASSEANLDSTGSKQPKNTSKNITLPGLVNNNAGSLQPSSNLLGKNNPEKQQQQSTQQKQQLEPINYSRPSTGNIISEGGNVNSEKNESNSSFRQSFPSSNIPNSSEEYKKQQSSLLPTVNQKNKGFNLNLAGIDGEGKITELQQIKSYQDGLENEEEITPKNERSRQQQKEEDDESLTYTNQKHEEISGGSAFSSLSGQVSPVPLILGNHNEQLPKIEEKPNDSDSPQSRKHNPASRHLIEHKNNGNQIPNNKVGNRQKISELFQTEEEEEEEDQLGLDIREEKQGFKDKKPSSNVRNQKFSRLSQLEQKQQKLQSSIKSSQQLNSRWGTQSVQQYRFVSAVDFDGMVEEQSMVCIEEGLDGAEIIEIEAYMEQLKEQFNEYEKQGNKYIRENQLQNNKKLQEFKNDSEDIKNEQRIQLENEQNEVKRQLRESILQGQYDQEEKDQKKQEDNLKVQIEQIRLEKEAMLEDQVQQFQEVHLMKCKQKIEERLSDLEKLKKLSAIKEEQKIQKRVELSQQFEKNSYQQMLLTQTNASRQQFQIQDIERSYHFERENLVEDLENSYEKVKKLESEEMQKEQYREQRMKADLRELYQKKANQEQESMEQKNKEDLEEMLQVRKTQIDQEQLERYQEELGKRLELIQRKITTEHDILSSSSLRQIGQWENLIGRQKDQKIMALKELAVQKAQTSGGQAESLKAQDIRNEEIKLLLQANLLKKKELADEKYIRKQLSREDSRLTRERAFNELRSREKRKEFLEKAVSDIDSILHSIVVNQNTMIKGNTNGNNLDEGRNLPLVKDKAARHVWSGLIQSEGEKLDIESEQLKDLLDRIDNENIDATQRDILLERAQNQKSKLSEKKEQLVNVQKAFNLACDNFKNQQGFIEEYRLYQQLASWKIQNVEKEVNKEQQQQDEQKRLGNKLEMPFKRQQYHEQLPENSSQHGENQLFEEVKQNNYLKDPLELQQQQQKDQKDNLTNIINRSTQRIIEQKASYANYLRNRQHDVIQSKAIAIKTQINQQKAWCLDAKGQINKSLMNRTSAGFHLSSIV